MWAIKQTSTEGVRLHRASDVLVGLVPEEGLHIDVPVLRALEQRADGTQLADLTPHDDGVDRGRGGIPEALKKLGQLLHGTLLFIPGGNTKAILEVKVPNNYMSGRGLGMDEMGQ